MYIRPRIYYPDSHIIHNLYTNGKEWMLENGTEYIGFYHRYNDGLVLTEPYYSKYKCNKLIPYVDPSALPVNVYNKLKQVTISNTVSPVYYHGVPTMEDYSAGVFKRFFVYRRNYSDLFLDFFEVDEEQYKSWSKVNKGISEILYNGFTINWKLTGPEYDVAQDNRIIEFGVYDTNKRLAQYYDREFPGTSKVLTDYLEFSIYSPITSYDIKKQFGIV